MENQYKEIEIVRFKNQINLLIDKFFTTVSQNEFRTYKMYIDDYLKKYQMTFLELIAKTRERHYVEKRQLLQYILYKEFGLTYKKIGEEFNQDHTTVMHSVKLFTNLLHIKDRKAVLLYTESLTIL